MILHSYTDKLQAKVKNLSKLFFIFSQLQSNNKMMELTYSNDCPHIMFKNPRQKIMKMIEETRK